MTPPPADYARVPGYGDYAVSAQGHVLKLNDTGDDWVDAWITKDTRRGRRHVRLRNAAGVKLMSVAEVVLTTFVGPRPDRRRVAYLNGDDIDDRLDNLTWGWGNQYGAATSDDDVRDMIAARAEGKSLHDIADRFAVTEAAVSHILTGKRRNRNRGDDK